MSDYQLDVFQGDILIVDDVPNVSHLLGTMLTEQGYRVRSVSNGTLALQSVRSSPPDLILLDIMLSDMDGYAVCEQVKADKRTCDIPVIFISALNEEFDKTKAFSLGGVDYITKPFQAGEVLARIKTHLTLRNLQKRLQEQNAQLHQKIAERKQTEEELRKLSRAVEQSASTIIITDLDGTIEFVNPAFCKTTGYSYEEALGKTPRIIKSGRHSPEFYQELWGTISSGEVWQGELVNKRKNGEIYWEYGTISPVKDQEDRVTHYVCVKEDITELKQVEAALAIANQELQRLALLDGLTQVANRHRLDEYLLQEWKRLTREQAPLSLILCDIDYFKRYNDRYGHPSGDECLKRVAQGIRRVIRRPADLVARYGGEEFVVVLPNTNSEGAIHVARVIQKQIQQLKIPHEQSSISRYVTLSIGVSCTIPEQGSSPELLVDAADKAMYEVKTRGRNAIILKTLTLPLL